MLKKIENHENSDRYFQRELDEIFGLYIDACEWLVSLGFVSARTRYGAYKRHFEIFLAVKKSSDPTAITEEFKRSFDNAYLEAHELIRVHQRLKQLQAEQFIAQMRTVMTGSEFRNNSSNDQARDFLFELSIASRFLSAGYDVSMAGICDVVVDMGFEHVLFVECKRVKSLRNLGANVSKANKQIAQRRKAQPEKQSQGLVAVNATDLLRKPNGLFPRTQAAATAIHRRISNFFVEENQACFAAGQRDKCIGVMCESAMMFYLPDSQPKPTLMYSRHTDFLCYPGSTQLHLLAEQLSSQDVAISFD